MTVIAGLPFLLFSSGSMPFSTTVASSRLEFSYFNRILSIPLRVRLSVMPRYPGSRKRRQCVALSIASSLSTVVSPEICGAS